MLQRDDLPRRLHVCMNSIETSLGGNIIGIISAITCTQLRFAKCRDTVSTFWHSASLRIIHTTTQWLVSPICQTGPRIDTPRRPLFCIKSLAPGPHTRPRNEQENRVSHRKLPLTAVQRAVHDRPIARNGSLRPRNSACRSCRALVANWNSRWPPGQMCPPSTHPLFSARRLGAIR